MDRLQALAGTAGYFRRQDALEAGFDDKAINREIRARRWVRIRRGAYTFNDIWSAQDEVERHRITARAVVDRLGPGVALSHTSAVIEHGMAVWDADLSCVHVTRLDGGAGRTEAGVVHHEGFCIDDDLIEREDGLLMVKPARAALEHACLVSSESAVVTLDSGLHVHAFTRAEMESVFALMRSWPKSQRLQIVVRFADGRAESVGESRSRWLCYKYNLPAPELQFEVYDECGRLIGITDMAWPERKLLGEFDGKIKYGRLLRPGEEPGEAVFREKVREDALRAAVRYAMGACQFFCVNSSGLSGQFRWSASRSG